jgi:predicted GIY-YIG superfamily endonuclease
MAAYVYIAATDEGDFYVGLGKDLDFEMWFLRNTPMGLRGKHYRKLVFFEWYPTFREAKTAKNRLRRMKRKRKLELIQEENPHCLDLLPTPVYAGAHDLDLYALDDHDEPPATGGVGARLPVVPKPPLLAPGYEEPIPRSDRWERTLLHST